MSEILRKDFDFMSKSNEIVLFCNRSCHATCNQTWLARQSRCFGMFFNLPCVDANHTHTDGHHTLWKFQKIQKATWEEEGMRDILKIRTGRLHLRDLKGAIGF